MAKTTEAETKVSPAAILRTLKTKEAAAKTAAKKERPKGTRMDDSELIERLGLEVDQAKSFSANVNSVKLTCAKGDKTRPMFIFNYSLSSEDKNVNGVPVSTSFIIEDKKYTSGAKKGEVWESVDEVIEKLMFEFQALGFDTAAWAKKKDFWAEVEKACKEATSEKTSVRITLKPWESDTNSGLNVWVNPGMDNEDLEEEEAEEESEEEEEVEESEEESSEEEEESEEEESEEEETEEEESEEEEAEFDPDDYIDRWFDFDSGEDYGVVLVKPTKYYEKKNLFDCVDRDGNKWLVSEGYGAAPDKLDYNESENE